MSAGEQKTFRVYLSASISQVVEVEAETIEEAIQLAEDEADYPNASNSFELDGDDPHATLVYDTNNSKVWDIEDGRDGK